MNSQEYFITQSALTDPGEYTELLKALPNTIQGLCSAVQNLLLDYEQRYKYPIPNERLLETNTRYVRSLLGQIAALDGRPLGETRSPDKRFMASSSNFASLLCSMARESGIPARVRSGFVTYLPPRGNSPYRAHEITEYFDSAAGKWLRADPFIDPLTVKASGIDFDITNIPEGKFISAGQAWLDCAAGKSSPEDFRNEDNGGFGVVLSALILDLAAMNKYELLSWDRFGWMERTKNELWPDELSVLDEAAALLLDADESFGEMRALYSSNTGLQVTRVIKCDTPVVPPHKVSLTW